jgi:hypothetical protein
MKYILMINIYLATGKVNNKAQRLSFCITAVQNSYLFRLIDSLEHFKIFPWFQQANNYKTCHIVYLDDEGRMLS